MLKNILNKIDKYKTFLATFLLVCVIVVSLTNLASTLPDSDTFFIIKTGEYIVENKEVPTINPFVMHNNMETIIQQWGFDVIIYQLYSNFGYAGIFIFISIMFICGLLLIERFVSLYTSKTWLKLLCLSIFTLIFVRWGVARPTSISFLILLTTIIIIEKYRLNQNKWLIALLPLLSLIMINIHASMWPIMFVLILPFICPNIIELYTNFKSYIKQWAKKWWPIFLIIVIMLIMGFLNPNGLKGMGYVIISYGLASRVKIYELQPNDMSSIAGLLTCVGIICATIYIYNRKSKTDTAYIYMLIGTIILACMHVRNTWFLFFGVYPVALTVFDDIRCNLKYETKHSVKPKILAKAIVIVILILAIVLVATSYTFYVPDSNYAPLLAANYLDQFVNKDDIVLYTDFNNGAYMEFRGYLAYMDARPELFSKKITGNQDILTEWLDVRSFPSKIPGFIDKYNFSHIIVQDGEPFQAYLMNCEDYEEIIVGNGYSLYERIDWVGDSKLVHH